MTTKRPHRWGNPSPPASRGYGPAHQRARRRILRAEPYCRQCREDGRGDIAATFLDHIEPKCLGGTDHPDNLQPLCRDCSLTKTGREGAMMRIAKRRARTRGAG